MNILGITPFGHDTSSCVLVDGELIAFAEEERFTRVKLAANQIPVRSSRYCLEQAGLSLTDIDAVTIGWDNSLYPDEMEAFYASISPEEKCEYSDIYEDINILSKVPLFLEKKIHIAYQRAGMGLKFPPIYYYNHHESHANSVYYPSPFDEALILVADGSGEKVATTLWVGKGDEVSLLKEWQLPDSIGYFYAAMTEYLGFSVNTGEGKVMGLAPYGKSDLGIREKLDKVLVEEPDGYHIDTSYIYHDKRSYSLRHTDKLVRLMGREPRVPEAQFQDWHNNLAWEVQHKLEAVLCNILRKAIKDTGIRDICLGGGIAMNCKANGVIAEMPETNGVFVVPASTDAGCSYGSALLHSSKNQVKNLKQQAKKFSVYMGPSFSDQLVEDLLVEFKLRDKAIYCENDTVFEFTASKLKDGAIVGWFQDRMEMGSRALGNRSILANPAISEMKDKINREVKHREHFRPFAPAFLKDEAHRYMSISQEPESILTYSWMLKAVQANKGVAEEIPAVVHVDNSMRPQIVSEEMNSRFYRLLSKFYEVSQTPALLNTSFNVRGEPIVCKPEEAIRCFYSTGLDVLVINNWVLVK